MKMRTSIKHNKHFLVFLSVLFSLGIVFGMIIFYKQSDIVKEALSIELDSFADIIKNSKQNQIIFHSLVIGSLFLFSFTVLGVIGLLGYLFYEGCSIGFSIALFSFKFKITGALFSIIFNLITKLIFIIIIFYICIIGIKIAKKIIGSVVLKRNDITYLFIKRHLLILIIVLSVSVINELIIYFLGNKILSLFLFML